MTTLLQQTASGFAKSANRRLDAELCLISLCTPTLSLDAEALNARLSRLEDQIASGSFPVAATTPPAPAEEEAPPWDDDDAPTAPQEPEIAPAPQKDAPVGFWADFLTRVRPEMPIKVRGFFAPSGPVSGELSGEVLLITADSPFVKGMIDNEQVLKILRTAAASMLGRNVAVKIRQRGEKAEAANDGFDELLQFGQQHSDIFKIQ